MILQPELPFDDKFINKENCYYYNCHDNYIVIDNLDSKDLKTLSKEKFYCSSFYHAIYVLDGMLDIVVDGKIFHVGKNQYFLIMPCNHITFLNSKAKFFFIIARTHVVQSIYSNLSISKVFNRLAFTVRHYQLTETQINNVLVTYLKMRLETMRPDYVMKELVLRELVSIMIYESLANLDLDAEILYLEKSKQRELYLKFLNLLNKDYLYQRSVKYYADKLMISAKYLSFITNKFTGKSASAVIDTFVVLKVKVLLYDGEMNVKKISELFNFQSQSFFGRYFKRITGDSPREFIEKYNRRLYKVNDDNV